MNLFVVLPAQQRLGTAQVELYMYDPGSGLDAAAFAYFTNILQESKKGRKIATLQVSLEADRHPAGNEMHQAAAGSRGTSTFCRGEPVRIRMAPTAQRRTRSPASPDAAAAATAERGRRQRCGGVAGAAGKHDGPVQRARDMRDDPGGKVVRGLRRLG